jgi:succinoglycan biosynthesis transport protein ExoP
MTFSQFWSVLKARWYITVVVMLVLGAAAGGWSVLSPKQYLATASVMLDVRTPDPVATAAAPGTLQGGYMATQIDLIQTERVAQRAIRTLKMDQDPAVKAVWLKSTDGRGDFDAWLAEQVQKRLEVKPSRESSIINVGYLSADPEQAASMANAIVRSYIDTTLDLKVEPAKQYNAFFDDRAKQLRSALEAAQARLSAYQQAKGIVATDERLDVEQARLSELSTQVVMLQSAAADSAGKAGAGGANSPEVLSNMLVGNIAAELSRQEARLSELQQRLGDAHPQVVELRANVQQLRNRLATETSRVSSSLSITTSVDRSRLAQVKAALEEQRKRVLQMRGQHDEASVLVRDVDSAKAAYDAALVRVNQTNLESQNTQTNVSIVKTATAPAFANSPRPTLNTLVALLVGALIGVIVTLAREMMDRRIRFETDVVDGLRLPLLVSIPKGDSRGSGNPERLRRPSITAVALADATR